MTVSLLTYMSLLGQRKRCDKSTFTDTFKDVYLNQEVLIYKFDG